MDKPPRDPDWPEGYCEMKVPFTPAAIPAPRDTELREMLAPALLIAGKRIVEALDASLAGEPDHATRLAAAREILDRILGTPNPYKPPAELRCLRERAR